MIIRKLRVNQGWTQQQLAQYSGLSIRTVQRIEKGQVPSEESAKCLGAVFHIEAQDILNFFTEHHAAPLIEAHQEDNDMKNLSLTLEEQQAMREVDELKGFYQHLLFYITIITTLWLINWYQGIDYWWAIWPTLGWGVGMVSHGLSAFKVFKLFGPEWERREINKRLRK
ncbi:MAG: helix-turn-helix domain-containing protein [Gammaproteobacteria bacterium]|nr:helix-turn-helix domain-containing protein [Gammaproteobacteria bacterium]